MIWPKTTRAGGYRSSSNNIVFGGLILFFV